MGDSVGDDLRIGTHRATRCHNLLDGIVTGIGDEDIATAVHYHTIWFGEAAAESDNPAGVRRLGIGMHKPSMLLRSPVLKANCGVIS